MTALAGHLVRLEREDGVERLVILRRDEGAEHAVWFGRRPTALGSIYEFDTAVIRFRYSSPATPTQIFDYDVDTRARTLRKQERIPSGQQSIGLCGATTAGHHRRQRAGAGHRAAPPDLPIDGSAPLYLATAPIRSPSRGIRLEDVPAGRSRVRLCDRARSRRTGRGERWRNAGRLEQDQYLRGFHRSRGAHDQGRLQRPGRVVARGDSAGGLLMGAVANMRPDLFAGIVARVPFVDVLNTTLDDSLPLTVGDFPEWGDPIRDVGYTAERATLRTTMSPRTLYPHMLVTAGIRDPRVPIGNRRNGSPRSAR